MRYTIKFWLKLSLSLISWFEEGYPGSFLFVLYAAGFGDDHGIFIDFCGEKGVIRYVTFEGGEGFDGFVDFRIEGFGTVDREDVDGTHWGRLEEDSFVFEVFTHADKIYLGVHIHVESALVVEHDEPADIRLEVDGVVDPGVEFFHELVFHFFHEEVAVTD